MNSFREAQLPPELQSGLDQLQFKQPTKVQSRVIPMALQNRDLMVCAETGSGKTAAYAIPMVAQLLKTPNQRGLILAPTRELAHQIADFLRSLTTHCSKIQVTSIVGGADIRKQTKALKKQPRIVVATPGRLIDHLKRKTLVLKSTGLLVLDEGDRMLDMGFAPQLKEILEYLPKKRQTSLFTATLPKKVQNLAGSYLQRPEIINVGTPSRPVASIKQKVLQVSSREKGSRVVDELNQRKGSVIIFMRTKRRTDALAKDLSSYGFSVDLIHGGRSQGQRNRAIQNFRKGQSRILCATDIAARGIDVPQVEHVINFDLPLMAEDYVHRIGRTARNGAEGEALSLITPEDFQTWQALARKYQIQGVDLVEPKRERSNKARKGFSKKKKNNPKFKRKSGSGRSRRTARP